MNTTDKCCSESYRYFKMCTHNYTQRRIYEMVSTRHKGRSALKISGISSSHDTRRWICMDNQHLEILNVTFSIQVLCHSRGSILEMKNWRHSVTLVITSSFWPARNTTEKWPVYVINLCIYTNKNLFPKPQNHKTE